MDSRNLLAFAGAGVVGAVLLTAALSSANTAPKTEAAFTAPVAASAAVAGPAMVNALEADAWAEARAADTPEAYKVFLAAYPTGAFRAAAVERLAAEPKPEPAPAPVTVVRTVERAAPRAAAPRAEPVAYRGPTKRQIAAQCQAYVDRKLSQPSRVGRVVGGAAGGCAAGALAGGDDGRNCAVGALLGAGAGALTAENRERRRLQEMQTCMAAGGPP